MSGSISGSCDGRLSGQTDGQLNIVSGWLRLWLGGSCISNHWIYTIIGV